MEFGPNNNIVKLCLQGRAMEDKDKLEEASKLFLQAWGEATNDFEKYISAHYVARQQSNVSAKIQWLERSLQLALKINDERVKSTLSPLCSDIAQCYRDLTDLKNAAKYSQLATSYNYDEPSDLGPFYHGTKADLQIGDLLMAGNESNYKDEFKMNHIYFTALRNGAGLAASLAKGDEPERVYIVEPTGSFENDPNVTNNYFPGNPTRSYRSEAPLKIIGEITDWTRQTPEELQKWRERLANNKGEILN
jgi:hypothetical protein